MNTKPTYEELEQRVKKLEQEITIPKRAEEALREREATLRSIFLAAPTGIGMVCDRVITQANERLCEMLGYSQAELLGQNARILYSSDEEFEYVGQEKYAQISRQGTGTVETRWQCKDGKVIDVLLSSTPIDPDDWSRGVTFTALDITSRKQAEAFLRESEERYSSLFKNNHSVMLLIDPETADIVDVNSAACDFYGWRKEELASKKITDINTLTKEEVFDELAKAKLEKRNYFLFRHRLANGEIRNVEVYSGPIKVRGKQLLYSIVHDITERERLEAQLFQSQKMEAIAALAGGIAHQFNNALYAIVGSIELLECDLADQANVAAYTDQMKNATARMAQLTKQLLAYARGGKYQPRVISLSDFVRDTLPLIAYTLKPHAFVETDLPHDIMNVNADLTQIQMVLSAILTNASEAIEDRGRIRITCRNKVITDDIAVGSPGLKPGVYVSLKIVDDGKGMDEATKARVFEPFFSTKFQGRGLGMAAVYGIVKNHDGWIAVDSALNRGTTVRIYLPAVDTAVKALKESKSKQVKSTGTILYIEDEQIVLDVGQAVLERLGYHVLVAKTGKEAVRIAKAFKDEIDLAILDIVIPDMGAKDIYFQIREARPNIKVIVCSGYSIDGPAQEIIDAGAHGFIQKPFSIEHLMDKLNKVLNQ